MATNEQLLKSISKYLNNKSHTKRFKVLIKQNRLVNMENKLLLAIGEVGGGWGKIDEGDKEIETSN